MPSDLTPSEDSLEPVETWPTDRLRALQLQRLRWSLRHAWENVPHTRHALEDAKLHPDDLETLPDLARFPFTTKHDLRHAQPWGMLAVPRQRLARVHATAGTTGRPVLAGHTERDLAGWSALMVRSLRAAGLQPGWAVLVALPFGLSPFAHGATAGAERHGCTAIPAGSPDPAALARLAQTLQPQAIVTTPRRMHALLKACRAEGIHPHDLGLQVAVLGGEAWDRVDRATFEAACNLRALGAYGIAELTGPGLAQECVETQDGPTLWEDHVLPEIIDPRTRKVLPDGEEGELVLTSLTREAMPLIRYRTGDTARLLPGTARTHRRLKLPNNP